MVQRVVDDSQTALSRACWGRKILEASMGWVTQPVPLDDIVLDRIPLSPRFAIEEQHGAGKLKVRVIDDFKASQVNDLLGMVDTSVPETLDVFLAMLLTQGHHNPTADLSAFSVDFAHAYKQVGIAEAQADFATVVLADHAGVPHVASLKTQPFGSRRAPANWGRIATFFQFIMRVLFHMWVGVYVDDVFACEPSSLAEEAFALVKEVADILGLELSHDKESPPQ